VQRVEVLPPQQSEKSAELVTVRCGAHINELQLEAMTSLLVKCILPYNNF